jgi:hypothetical protein
MRNDSSLADQASGCYCIALWWIVGGLNPFRCIVNTTLPKMNSQTPLTNVVSTNSVFKNGSSSRSAYRSSPYCRKVSRVTLRKYLFLGMELLKTTWVSTSTPRRLASCDGDRTIKYWPQSPLDTTGRDVTLRPNDS